MNRFAITSKKTRNPISQEHYLDYLDSLSELGTVMNVAFETTRGLHVHFVLETVHDLSKKDSKLYRTKYGWNHLAVPVYYQTGWTNYSRKDFKKNKELNEQSKRYADDDFSDDMSTPFKMPTRKLF